jgi:hypothetical protein
MVSHSWRQTRMMSVHTNKPNTDIKPETLKLVQKREGNTLKLIGIDRTSSTEFKWLSN